MKILVTGASGFIGSRLLRCLQMRGYQVLSAGRKGPAAGGTPFVQWDPQAGLLPAEALQGVHAVVHLAGEPVAQRWNSEVKRRIRESRVIGTRNLVSSVASHNERPPVLIAASAVGYYGDRGDEVLTEESAPGSDFLASVCQEWEAEAEKLSEVRVVRLRLGVVLSAEGGALKQMITPFRAGVGGPIGSGSQWVPWIHCDDVAQLIAFLIEHDKVSGAVNAAAPQQCRNSDFVRELGDALNRPSFIPIPALGLRLLFGEMSQVLLASQRVQPAVAAAAGFAWRYPELGGAFRAIFNA